MPEPAPNLVTELGNLQTTALGPNISGRILDAILAAVPGEGSIVISPDGTLSRPEVTEKLVDALAVIIQRGWTAHALGQRQALARAAAEEVAGSVRVLCEVAAKQRDDAVAALSRRRALTVDEVLDLLCGPSWQNQEERRRAERVFNTALAAGLVISDGGEA